MRKKSENKKGFTLAELLVVVAIVAVLTAIAIPVFAGALEKSAEAADLANLRGAYAELTVKFLEDRNIAADSTKNSITIPATQTQSYWQTAGAHGSNNEYFDIGIEFTGGSTDTVEVEYAKKGDSSRSKYKLTIDANGKVTASVTN